MKNKLILTIPIILLLNSCPMSPQMIKPTPVIVKLSSIPTPTPSPTEVPEPNISPSF